MNLYKVYLNINNSMNNAFVYEWTNVSTGKKYIGYHKGSPNDGYISSSKNEEFWHDHELNLLERKILFEGTVDECVQFESNLLRQYDFKNLYNRNFNGKIVFTDDVRNKIKGKLLNKKQTPEHILARSNALKGRTGGFAGKKHQPDTIAKMKTIAKSEEHKKAISESLKGRPGNFVGKTHKKIKCWHCGKDIAANTFSRWHGDACKLNRGANHG